MEVSATQQTFCSYQDKGLAELPHDFVETHPSLTRLNLDNNLLTRLPEGFAQLTNLSSLHLSRNRLTLLPPAIAQLSQLKELDLSHNQLTACTFFSSLPPSLQTIDLSHNDINTFCIKEEICTQKINLSSNGLTSIALPYRPYCRHIVFLDLSNNSLSSIPQEIRFLTSLSTLDLRTNPLLALPWEITMLATCDVRIPPECKGRRGHLLARKTNSENKGDIEVEDEEPIAGKKPGELYNPISLIDTCCKLIHQSLIGIKRKKEKIQKIIDRLPIAEDLKERLLLDGRGCYGCERIIFGEAQASEYVQENFGGKPIRMVKLVAPFCTFKCLVAFRSKAIKEEAWIAALGNKLSTYTK